MAGQVTGGDNPSQYYRVQFYMAETAYDEQGKPSSVTIKWVKSISCYDLYAEQIASEEGDDWQNFFTTEFTDKNWICPDVTDLSIGLNPYEKLNGTAFTMVVNECSVAKEID